MLNKPRLLTPGPTPLPEQIRLAMAQDMIHHRKSAFKLVMAELQERLRLLFGTAQPVMPLACSGSGVMTAAVTNLFAPGEKVIVVDGGKFGERWIKISEGHGLQVVTVKVEWGNAVSVAEVEAALDAHPDARGLLIQNSETSTGALHPVHLLGGLTRARNMLLVVDGISSVGISPCPMDELDIDCLVTGSQKGLMLPPGLGLIALSERAWAKAETVPPACFYFNLLSERANCLKNQTLFTTPVSLIIGLNESMKMFMEAGLDTVYRKQWALTMFARTSVKEMGLELLAKDRFTWGLTSVMLPEGIDGSKLLEIAAERFGVYMAGGQDHLKGRAIRIGHMGWVDWADLAAGLHALAESFRACGGYIGSRDYLEKGLQAYHEALLTYDGSM
ncbi:alanine--glyoxylate aminotransferase family protein [Desulfovibrio subterraneus]|jgi:aspartate aminotransferase-like enzyme|uniref:Aminotransferase n=1 Tax=Desulfovibrio subterraneus TaxID=2718620 RepID=A0A7J0BEC0_9BACT|nr:alanine--glyoxylate aminotransferase family protein [Desulfovibrio subterraneus]WBF68818.1 alanine--glyoxylate aminotransferase family protein [Desulfovibrio subterraneus]GFM32016.1 aminotransferase [Desulfovibrio subterraneus]